MLSRMKFDIEDLVVEMLDQLPSSVWTSTTTTFFDPAFGGGQFVREIERRLRAAGHSDENIHLRVFGFEESELHVRFAVNKYKLVGQYAKKTYDNFLEMDNSMKFDVVIGNPPYQDTHRSGNPLWPLFVKKAFDLTEDDGYTSMITPGRWVLPGHNIKENKIRIWDNYIGVYNTLAVNLGECSKHFSVGGSDDYFSYFITEKSKTHSLTKITTQDQKFDIDLKSINWLPYRNCNIFTINILKKILSKRYPSFDLTWKYDRSHNDVKESSKGKYNVPIFFGRGNVKYSDHTSDLHSSPKVLFKLGRFIPYIDRVYIDKLGNMSYNSAYVACINKNEDVSYLESKLYIFIASCLFNGSEITAEGYRTLPRLPSKTWTDTDLYHHFGLTQEEIDYIESNAK